MEGFKGRVLHEEGLVLKEWKTRIAILKSGVLHIYKVIIIYKSFIMNRTD